MSFFTGMLEHYGYIVLFLALLLELIGFPLPGEFIMTYAGLVVSEGRLNWGLSILAAVAGACFGMTISYWLGFRLGRPFFEKYGARVHLGPEKVADVSRWFQKYGNKMLLIAYFIPGVRHITGLFSGTTKLPFRKYAAYAFTGAFLWVSLFISLGKWLGPKWELYHHTVNRYMLIIGVVAATFYLGALLFRKNKEELRRRLASMLERGLARFRSARRVRFTVIAAFAFFVVFVSLMIGLIQDLLAHEFEVFDEVAAYLVQQIFDAEWTAAMNLFVRLGTYPVWVPVMFISGLWIWFRGKDRLLELSFLAWVAAGGEGVTRGLQLLFHRSGAEGSIPTVFTFPSEPTMLAFAIYGYAAYVFIRHSGNWFLRIAALLPAAVFCGLVGISHLYFQDHYASDLAAGYVFGGVWLSLNVMLLEVFRLLRRVQ